MTAPQPPRGRVRHEASRRIRCAGFVGCRSGRPWRWWRCPRRPRGRRRRQPTANGTGGAAASVDPLATQAAIDVHGGRRQRLRRGDRRRERARRRRAVQLRHRRRRLHGHPRRQDGQDHDDRLAREVARRRWSRAASSSTASRRPTRSSRSTATAACRAGVPGTPYAVGVHAAPLRHATSSSEALAYGVERRAARASRSTRRSSTRRRPTRRTSTTSRRPRRSTSTPTARRRTSAPTITQPGHGQDLRAASAGTASTKGFYTRPGRRRDRQGRHDRSRRSAPTADHTWRPGPADQPRPRALRGQGPRARRARLLRPRASTAWARRPPAAPPSSRR